MGFIPANASFTFALGVAKKTRRVGFTTPMNLAAKFAPNDSRWVMAAAESSKRS